MSTQSQPQDEPLNEQMVADYLRNHPDFFANQAALLTELRIPHTTGVAVSLIERQVAVLRDQNEQVKRKLVELVRVGEDNERLTERVHSLTLALLEANSVKDVIDTLHLRLQKEFSTDAVSIRLATLPEESMPEGLVEKMEPDDVALIAHKDAFKEHKPVCGRLNEEQIQQVFAGCQVAVQSAALIPLAKDDLYGYLGLGSKDPDHFHRSKDTLFLRYLGGVTGQILAKFQETDNKSS